MKYFDSLKSYFQFAAAREFVYKETCTPFSYLPNRLEKMGEILAKPLFHPADRFLKNIRNPLYITALVVGAIALTTLVFYPALFPGFVSLAYTIKFGAYVLTQSLILGFCLRTLGRLSHPHLMNAWTAGQLHPVTIGSVIVSNKIQNPGE